MDKPTKEQSKEFWGRFGFLVLCEPDDYGIQAWQYPNQTRPELSLPKIDINNLFKYAIPELLEKYDIKITSFWDALNNKTFWFVHLQDRISDEVEFDTVRGYEKLEDALFWICWEVIHG